MYGLRLSPHLCLSMILVLDVISLYTDSWFDGFYLLSVDAVSVLLFKSDVQTADVVDFGCTFSFLPGVGVSQTHCSLYFLNIMLFTTPNFPFSGKSVRL